VESIKQLIFFLIAINFILGCSANNTEVSVIEQNKQDIIKESIEVSSPVGYKAYLNKKNDLEFICADSNKQCKYETKKESYLHGTPSEEFVWINKNGYYPPFAIPDNSIQCGKGSFAGFYLLLGYKYRDYTALDPVECNSRFTEFQSIELLQRFTSVILTVYTSLLTSDTLYTKYFNRNDFINDIYESNIETFRSQVIKKIHKYNIHAGLDVIYLQKGNVASDLNKKYIALLQDRSIKDGIIFMNKHGNKLIFIDIFKKYGRFNVFDSITAQTKSLLQSIAKGDNNTLMYKDILPYIPATVALPKIPPMKKIVKSEFETKKQFEKRVEKAVREREDTIRRLQKKYALQVLQRNTYIQKLQEAYDKYLHQENADKIQLIHELQQALPQLSKVLFLENISGYNAKNFHYDAETSRLYFTIFSQEGKFTRQSVATVPADIAKRIKEKKTFAIVPQIKADTNKLVLKGFKIVDTVSKKKYNIAYTNIYYRPEEMSLRIAGLKTGLHVETSKYFKKFKQSIVPIADSSKKEIWYIDVVKNIDAKTPKWFSHPLQETDGKIIAYGEGTSLEKAKAQARSELAYMVQVKVNTKFDSTQEVGSFKHFKYVKEQTDQSSDITLSSNQYRLYRQEQKDGIWYVGFEYINPKEKANESL
jgi:hypothetical protein